MKKSSRIFAVILILALVLSACGQSGTNSSTPSSGTSSSNTSSSATSSTPEDEGEFDPMARYDETVTVRLIGDADPATDSSVFSKEDNPWIDMLLEEYNIKVEFLWSSSDYQTKLDLSIASDDLPDVFFTNTYTQFNKLARGGKLQPIDGLFEKYLRPEYQEYVRAANPNFQTFGSYNGSLYGINPESPGVNNGRMVIVRDDWMEELNLSAPTCMEDVIAIGKAFVDNGKATYALPLNKDVAITSDMCDITAVANAYGAYPKIWLEDGQGGLKYGTIQPEMKEALRVYADLYKGGYIDPAFASLDGNKSAEYLTNDQIGLVMGPFWLITWPLNSVFETEGVDWSCYAVPASKTYSGPMKQQISHAGGKYYVVNKDYDHPEVLFKILNATNDKLSDPDPKVQGLYHTYVQEDGTEIGVHMLTPLGYCTDSTINANTQINVTAAIDADDESKLVSAHDILQFPKVKNYITELEAGNQPDTSDWVMYKLFYGDTSCYGVVNHYLDNDEYIYDALAGYVTDTMNMQYGNLQMLEDQYIVEFISGTKDIDNDWDEFVDAWNAMGGSTIYTEVNDWYKG